MKLFNCCACTKSGNAQVSPEEHTMPISKESEDEQIENPLLIEDEIPKAFPLLEVVSAKSEQQKSELAILKPEPRWDGKIFAPTNIKCSPMATPKENLEVEWVYGYRASQCRNNVKYGRMSERTSQIKLVIFPAASLGVVYDPSTHTQTFYCGHKSVPIGALETHPAGDIVATGEITQNAEIHVWKTGNGIKEDGPKGICILTTAENVKGVASLAFSQDGSIIGAVVLNAENDILIYDWGNNSSPVTKVNGYSDTVFGIAFNPFQKREFTTYGVRHVRFWQLEGNLHRMTMSSKATHYSGKAKPQTTFAGCYLKNKMMATGNIIGSVLFWKGQSLHIYMHSMHKGPIYTMTAVSSHQDIILLTAGRDSRVIIWNDGCQPVSEIAIDGDRCIRSLHCGVFLMKGTFSSGKSRRSILRSGYRQNASIKSLSKLPSSPEIPIMSQVPINSPLISSAISLTNLANKPTVDPAQSNQVHIPKDSDDFADNSDVVQVVVGCEDSTIWVIEATSGIKRVLLSSHSAASNMQTWGLAVHPSDPLFLTVGDDGTARIWSVTDKRLLYKKILGVSLVSCDWSPDGRTIAIGGGDGSVLIMNSDLSNIQSKLQHRKNPVHDIKYAPNGNYLAIASHDCVVDVYMVELGAPVPWYQRVSICGPHWTYVSRIDWSEDGQFIRSNSAEDEIQIFDSSSGDKQPPTGVARNASWATSTCPLAWGAHGLWLENEDYGLPGDRMYTVTARDGKVLAAGTADGKVVLTNWPAWQKNPPRKTFSGHASSVSNFRFIASADHHRRAISLGSRDACIIQWKIDCGSVNEATANTVT